jgi:hypothetical protein
VVKEAPNRYVTWLIDIVFKPEELILIPAQDVSKDTRYELIKGNFLSS